MMVQCTLFATVTRNAFLNLTNSLFTCCCILLCRSLFSTGISLRSIRSLVGLQISNNSLSEIIENTSSFTKITLPDCNVSKALELATAICKRLGCFMRLYLTLLQLIKWKVRRHFSCWHSPPVDLTVPLGIS